ncbi:hydantoinase B/oxoprolinase [Colletotrichum orchidophilum]|uniref:Hydantoinase B/oxoprolinase n=1 Tax=Colletotrichum orchidophilum TaxID=1209926 RepID=A0A1G4ARY6_9PEZI|nr:hydantoinase B/oxoprolinase [Colletotrichum orchidophilum]OHE91871.1 hydantoinase B/oxoprolinase [Colletotrichum orchidophilum]
MSYAAAYQADRWRHSLRLGDVLVSNHPVASGCHLPNMTVISPVIDEDTQQVLFWTASRAHHADISAASMSPHSEEIWQEGASFLSFTLVDGGRSNEEDLAGIMFKKPASYPRLVQDSIKEYGLLTVQVSAKYMLGIQDNAEKAAEDQMNDGSKLKFKICVDRNKDSAVFDLTGTSRETYGNLNAPRAITFSTIIYVSRSLVKEDTPLNQGCLAPINVIILPKLWASPSLGAATIGGNVEMSQGVTDVLLRAFQAAAASQGKCSNLTFEYEDEMVDGQAKPGFGYYETIAGGVEPPIWSLLRHRFLCILREFGIWRGLGGRGNYAGGDGCVRDMEFRRDLHVNMPSERRTMSAYGLAGGEPGALRENIWVRHDEYGTREIKLGGKNRSEMKKGTRIIINEFR